MKAFFNYAILENIYANELTFHILRICWMVHTNTF